MLQHLHTDERQESVAVINRVSVDLSELNDSLHDSVNVQLSNNPQNEEQKNEQEPQQIDGDQIIDDDIAEDDDEVLDQQTMGEVHEWFKAYDALDLFANFGDFRCVADIVGIREEEFIEVGIITLRDKLTLRRMIKEYESPQNVIPQPQQSRPTQQPQPQPQAQPQPQPPNDEDEAKRVPAPTQEAVDDYVQYGLFFVIHSGETKSGKMRKRFSDNTNKEPHLLVKKYMPAPHSMNSKKYKYSPHIIIRQLLEGLKDLGIISLKNVKDPADDRGAKWWSAEVEFEPLRKAGNNATVEERKKIYKFLVRSTRGNGGYVDWWRYVGSFREPRSVNAILNVEEQPNFEQELRNNGH